MKTLVEWIKGLGKPKVEPWQPEGGVPRGLKRLRLPDIKIPVGDWRWGSASRPYPQYRYFCPCGETLTAGPCGGAAVNAVCEKCRINYGCLPYFEHE